MNLFGQLTGAAGILALAGIALLINFYVIIHKLLEYVSSRKHIIRGKLLLPSGTDRRGLREGSVVSDPSSL